MGDSLEMRTERSQWTEKGGAEASFQFGATDLRVVVLVDVVHFGCHMGVEPFRWWASATCVWRAPGHACVFARDNLFAAGARSCGGQGIRLGWHGVQRRMVVGVGVAANDS